MSLRQWQPWQECSSTPCQREVRFSRSTLSFWEGLTTSDWRGGCGGIDPGELLVLLSQKWTLWICARSNCKDPICSFHTCPADMVHAYRKQQEEGRVPENNPIWLVSHVPLTPPYTYIYGHKKICMLLKPMASIALVQFHHILQYMKEMMKWGIKCNERKRILAEEEGLKLKGVGNGVKSCAAEKMGKNKRVVDSLTLQHPF